jgi:hypothetical protein
MDVHIKKVKIHENNMNVHVKSMNVHVNNMNVHEKSMKIHVKSMNIHVKSMKIHVKNMKIHVKSMNVHVKRVKVDSKSMKRDIESGHRFIFDWKKNEYLYALIFDCMAKEKEGTKVLEQIDTNVFINLKTHFGFKKIFGNKEVKMRIKHNEYGISYR